MRTIGLLAALTAFGLSGLGAPASAQSGLEPPPSFQTADRFGVDVISGNVSVSSPSIAVGDPARGGLSFTATWDSNAGGWRYSNWGEISKEIIKPDHDCRAHFTVVYMGSSNIFRRFDCTATDFVRVDGLGKFVETASHYVYTANDGSVATYEKVLPGALLSIARPNGEVITYTYSGLLLTSVSNNFGYQLHFQYAGGLSKVTAVNNAVDACALAASSCTFSQTWPSLTFTTSGNERSVTDALGRTTRVILDTSNPVVPRVIGVARPSQSSGASISYTQTFVRCGGYRVTSVTEGSSTWTYTYDVNDVPGVPCAIMDYDQHSTSITDPNTGVTTYTIGFMARGDWTEPTEEPVVLLPVLHSIKNPLNQTTLVSQSGVGLRSATYPEGNAVTISRNALGGVTLIRNTAKPGSGLADTTVSAVYPSCSSEPLRCRFPTSVTDAGGATTDYTYDLAGNLLTETGPAPTPGAARPQTRYTWEQRYAWYKRNGSASITQAASPVWVLVEQSQCMTGATC